MIEYYGNEQNLLSLCFLLDACCLGDPLLKILHVGNLNAFGTLKIQGLLLKDLAIGGLACYEFWGLEE